MKEPEKIAEELEKASRKPVTRRAAVKAAWAVPVVLASLSVPKNAFAQYAPCGPDEVLDDDGNCVSGIPL